MSMSCSISSTVTSAGRRLDGGEDFLALGVGNAGRRLVKQKHARAAGESKRNLEEALLAIGQNRRPLLHDIDEPEALEQFADLIDHARSAADGAPPMGSGAKPLGYRKPERFKRRQVAKQLVDLKRAGHAEPHPTMRLDIGDVLAVKQDLAARRTQHTGQEIDDSGLACAVGADQGVPRPLFEAERHLIGGDNAAKTLFQRAGFEHGRHG